ncbi:MAG TPA: OB-fold nucleic acid binding domain-containing protein [Bryobacteraceae bacterium]|jgi:3'-5' exoribonuclease|nr:OB-fold nucleic acid binding domain-containing protein [Bryobacteraceae bacterium]
MKSLFVRDLKPDEISTTVFLVSAKEVRQKRTGEPYLSLLLSDRTGELDCKMWDNVAGFIDAFDRDDFIKVKGMLQLYNNRPQFTIHKLRRMAEHEVDFRDFFPASLQNPDVMWAELRTIVAAVGNPHIRALLDSFLDDPDIAARYRIAPAAKSIHHAFRSGLLEHVLSLLKLAKVVGAHYRDLPGHAIDLDLLTAGVVLHDIGKIYELNYDRGFGYSAEGQLLGHIAIAIRMIGDRVRALPDFPVELRNLLEHMVLSHHGQLEFGSPKVPCFPEALLLHYLDDMDSKMECMRAQIDKDPQSEGYFSAYSSSMGRVALRKTRYLESNPAGVKVRPLECAAEEASASEFPLDSSTHTSTTHNLNDYSPDEHVRPGLPDNDHSLHPPASNSSTPNQNGHPPALAPPNSKPMPASDSFFGAKLQQALQDERK